MINPKAMASSELSCLPKGIEHGLLGSLDQGIRLAAARATEVIVIDGPEHDATQPVGDHIFRLLAHNVLIIVANPLVAPVGIGSHHIGIGLHHSPVGILLECLTDLQSEER